MDDLNNLLEQLHGGQGQVVSSGRFTLDLRKAREKLRKFQLAEPCFYLMKVLQAAVAAGAERLDVNLGRRTVGFYACLPPNSALSQPQPLMDGLQDPQGLPAGALRHLAVGLNSAWSVDPAFISLSYWSAQTHSGWRLGIGQEEIELGPCPACPSKPAPEHFPGLDRLEFWLERDTSMGSYVKSVASEHMGILHRCAFCPVPLYLDSRRVIGQWGPPEPFSNPEMGASYFLAERILVDPQGGFRLCAPPWDRLSTIHESLVNCEEVTVPEGSGQRTPTFSYQGVTRDSTDTLRARLALALPASTTGATRIVLVKDGVTLEPVAPRRMTHIGLQVLVHSPDVTVDLSEFTAIQGPQLEAHLNNIMSELSQLLAALRPLHHLLPRHRIRPGSEQINTGCSYMLGCMFFNVLGLALAAAYQWFNSRVQKNQHIELRDRLRSRLGARLDELAKTASKSS